MCAIFTQQASLFFFFFVAPFSLDFNLSGKQKIPIPKSLYFLSFFTHLRQCKGINKIYTKLGKLL